MPRVTIICPLTDEPCVKSGNCKINYCANELDSNRKAEDAEFQKLIKTKPEGWAERVLEILGLI